MANSAGVQQLEKSNDLANNSSLKSNSNNRNLVESTFNILNENEYEENDDDYDYIDANTQNDTLKQTTCKLKQMPPHEKNAINFIINEYLLENSYKMTSITFSEENESQDLEDWDVIGLNKAKPPNLLQLYKCFLSKNSKSGKKEVEKKKENPVESFEIGTQVETTIQVDSNGTNTNPIEYKEAETFVNFDRDSFENQRVQINKLLEKQEILLKSLSKLENEIGSLNTERESSFKKIDLL